MITTKNILLLSTLTTLTFTASLNTYANSDEDKGLEIAKEVDKHDHGWKDSTASLKMVLRNKHGEESHRAIRIKVLEVDGDGDKSLTIFDDPPDVSGTAFLSYSHVVDADEQWLFLPALKRVKRISSSNKSGPFMGSQFSYEDLASFEVKKYNYKYLRDEAVMSHDAHVVENYPLYKNSGYTRQIVWIDKDRLIPLKVEYYDRKNELLKTLQFEKYQQYLGKYWRAHKQFMQNHQNGKTTQLTFNDFNFSNGFSKRDFDRSSLKRIR